MRRLKINHQLKRFKMLAITFCIFPASLILSHPTIFAADPDKKGLEFFEKKIRPVLVNHCYECHSEDSKEVGGELLLDTRDGTRAGGESGTAVAPKRIEESLLIEAIKHDSFEMPPDKKLPDSVIADFEKWIQIGAPDPRKGKKSSRLASETEAAKNHWAFRPLKTSTLPKVRNESWVRSDIDHFILATLEEKKIRPVSDANRYTLLRRATYDLTGLPPTPTEIQSFLNDKSEDAFAKVVDRLLSSERFGEHWGRHWLDVARYADSSGGGRDFTYVNAWKYRDYVIESFNTDKPYDQFVSEQVAGDLLDSKNDSQRSEQLIATGFLVIGPKNLGERDKEVTRLNVIDEQIDTVGRAFLGLTLGCARCHKHKFDPVSMGDYYALAGIFSSTRTLKKPKPMDSQSKWQPVPLPVDKELAKELEAKFKKKKDAAYQVRNEKLEYVKKLEAELKKVQHEKPVDFKTKITSLEKQLAVARLEGDIASGKYSIFNNYIKALPMAIAVVDVEKPTNENIRIRGLTHSKGKLVSRGFLSVLVDDKSDIIPIDQSGRIQLANWMTKPTSPASALSSRVMVNRIWRYLFGAGLVLSTDNFGVQGEKPSHPELLDYLAADFIKNGWSVKREIRKIMLSRVYQLAAEQQKFASQIDPDNRFLWRTNGRRMDVESIRDSILTISGLLDEKKGGSTLPVIGSLGSSFRGYRTIDINPFYRRGVYLPIIRSGLSSSMDMYNVFDFPDSGLVTGKRNSTTVPTQALYLMNSPFMVKNAKSTAETLLKQASTDSDAERVNRIFLTMLGRPVTAKETAASVNYIKSFEQEMIKKGAKAPLAELEAWTSFCQSLFACNEFLFLN